jgi:hypothetical protein
MLKYKFGVLAASRSAALATPVKPQATRTMLQMLSFMSFSLDLRFPKQNFVKNLTWEITIINQLVGFCAGL